MARAQLFAFPIAVTTLFLLMAQGCGSDDPPDAFGTSGGGRRDGGSGEGEICLLNNCESDRDCGDCEKGRSVCFQQERRCIACGPNAGNKQCPAGSYCTKYGDCVQNGINCAEDGAGVPTITCKNTADCGACGPKYRVCNTSTGKCVGCQADNVSNCQSTDMCKNDVCVPKCPKECINDGDCSACGIEGSEAHACNKHVCAQCSPTMPCPNGDKCDLEHGTCVKPCGLGRAGKTNCFKNENCEGCEATTQCKLPTNGGEGACVVPATGCSEIGKSIIVLPDPFSRYTNACSTDADCSNVSADLNVGKILRKVTGIDKLKDGNLSYAMHACSSVEVLDKSCGVCVPCRQDADCEPIDLARTAGEVFGPFGAIGTAILLDQVFGPNAHKIHMFCQNVAGDYGVCLPCPNILGACAQTSEGLPLTGSCDHDVCQTGNALGLNCSAPCVAQVCAKDPYCCLKEWDQQCKVDVDLYCSDRTCEPDKCIYRSAGWYCFDDSTKGGYFCDGEPGVEQIAAGWQCADGEECRREARGPKEAAILCTSEGVAGCPVGSLGKPKCFKQ